MKEPSLNDIINNNHSINHVGSKLFHSLWKYLELVKDRVTNYSFFYDMNIGLDPYPMTSWIKGKKLALLHDTLQDGLSLTSNVLMISLVMSNFLTGSHWIQSSTSSSPTQERILFFGNLVSCLTLLPLVLEEMHNSLILKGLILRPNTIENFIANNFSMFEHINLCWNFNMDKYILLEEFSILMD